MKNYVTTLGIALMLALPHAAQAQVVTPPPVPTDIEVPPPDHAFLLGRGIGTHGDAQDAGAEETRSWRIGWRSLRLLLAYYN